MSITVACNFFREPNTLPGFFECYSRWADDIFMLSCPPSGAPPDEESIEIVKKWGARLAHGNIDQGFGAVRTRLIQEASTEWVLISDCDERVWAQLPLFECVGSERYPDTPNPNLSVGIKESAYSQIDIIRSLVRQAGPEINAIRFVRRHWMNWAMTRPAQNWDHHPDWQLRMMRRRPSIGYDTAVRMHERALDSETGRDPEYLTASVERGPYYDHMHLPAKAMEKDQRAEDIRIYDALSVDGHEQKLKEIYGK